MAEPLRTDLTSATDRALHPGQHNEINRRFLALEAAGAPSPGDGLTAAPDGTLNVGGTPDRITAGPDTIDIAATYAGQASITKLGTVTAGKWNADPVAVAYGGTGATDAANARTNLGITAGGASYASAYKFGAGF